MALVLRLAHTSLARGLMTPFAFESRWRDALLDAMIPERLLARYREHLV